MLLRFGRPVAIDSVAKLDELERSPGCPQRAIARAQVEAAGRRWDGQQLDAEARLQDWKGFCSYVAVYDGERHAFDAWFYVVETGTFFVAGTTQPVAQVVDGKLECDDLEVLAQLQSLLRGDSQ